MVSGILLMMVMGIVEFGNAFSAAHTLTSLSREGANLAARGTSLNESVNVVLTNGTSLQLSSKGGAIATRLVVQGGTPQVAAQVASSGYAGASQLGNVGAAAQGVDTWGLVDGQSIYVMELFYNYDQITPFGNLVQFAIPGLLYERAVF